MLKDLHQFIQVLRKEREIVEIRVPVDPYLEAAEIHRRVVEKEGPALLFTSINGAAFPVVTNLFGNRRRIELAFGPKPEEVIRQVAKLPETLFPPTASKLWEYRSLLGQLLKVGTKHKGHGPVTEIIEHEPRLSRLPLLTTWEKDGGAFFTWPLVYTEHPVTKVHNLGVYRMQRYDDSTTGMHFQIGKGGGFHLAVAREQGEKLPVNVFVGGPPALMLAAVAPLPENAPELLLASLILGEQIHLSDTSFGPLPVVSEAEFAFVGEVDPTEMRPEGPFGDHYGYYSLKHDYPVFRCRGVVRRKNPIFTATVVGKPRQEDFYIGDYLQELLSPIFPIVMPTVVDLWSYGETGYHSLASAVVKQRYKREAMVAAFRILGEGQLSLTKFLLVVDQKLNLRDFKSVLEHVLARADFRSDLYVFSNLAMDTLDYTGPKVNEGSKGVLLGVGDPIRNLTGEFTGELPRNVKNAIPFCKGCLVIDGPSHIEEPNFGENILKHPSFERWPLIILVDNARTATQSVMSFLWTTFTRFEPGADIKAAERTINRNHISYTPPLLIDARLKGGFPDELVCDEKTASLVSKRWSEYF